MSVDLPINHLKEIDKQHRAMALDASKSFIVQAPAGSGKTELLIQRFLKLLHHVKLPEEILAITFTKKAANEMRARIIHAINLAQHNEPESEHAKLTWALAKKVMQRDQQLGWNIIHNPNRLRIQTIDSLCSYLTKQLPLLAHFGSVPNISDDPSLLYHEAVKEVLTHVEKKYAWSDAIAELLLHLDNDLNKLHELLIHLLAKRDQWMPYLKFNDLTSNHQNLKGILEQHIASVIHDSLKRIIEVLPHEIISELLTIARFAANNLQKNANCDNMSLKFCCDQKQLLSAEARDKATWLFLAKLLLTKSFSWRKRVDETIGFPPLNQLLNPAEKKLHQEYRQRLLALTFALSTKEDLRSALTELFYLPEPDLNAQQWKILQALLTVLKVATAQLRVIFQQAGTIDFVENVQAALTALGQDDSPTDLALSLDYRIQHILMDEFQDTSLTQYQLLTKLTTGWEANDGRTLFVVGDPMQSIYRFREAEVGLFIRMCKQGIGNIQLFPLTLTVNFRSTMNIVNWNNAYFEKIFPSFDDIATGAVKYNPSVSLNSDTNSHIEIKGFLANDDSTQMNYLVNLIENIKDRHETIAILVRSRSHLMDVIPALKKAKIPFSALDIDSLASQQIIQDLLSLTCALLHPADRIAWLSILRAPWCGLTLSDLLEVAKNPYALIPEQLANQQVMRKLSPDGQTRINKVYPILKAKISNRQRENLRAWIETTWYLLGGPACLSDEIQIADVHAFFNLLETCLESNPMLDISILKDRMKQLYAKSKTGEKLQIMTIHTAKGLEFDAVIIPHLERKTPTDDKTLLNWLERPLANEQMALLLSPIHATGEGHEPLYEYIRRQHQIKANYETDRLLYVTTTRAKQSLYLLFDVQSKDNQDYKIESGSFLEKLWPHLDNESIITTDFGNTPADHVSEGKTHSIRRLTAYWENPIKEKTKQLSQAHLQQSGFQLKDNKPRLTGIILHQVLQQISLLGISWWTEKSSADQLVYLHQQLKEAGILPNDIDAISAIASKAIETMLNDERGQWILHSHRDAQAEFRITAELNGDVKNLIVDKTFIDEAGMRWIIDFKTTTFTQKDLHDFLANEQKKYLEKMHLYYQAMKLFDPIHPIQLGLYFPALPAWKAWDPKLA